MLFIQNRQLLKGSPIFPNIDKARESYERTCDVSLLFIAFLTIFDS